ncbi:TetR family transcriptional regulator [Variovorax paradoxus]|nr:TetR family transcriptional regulator [Variovorax paradoxus]
MVARRTKEEALATRNRLLDAAELLFQAQGVSQTSLQQIAHQAGATRGAIYWHFKDKADLFNAMMERVILPLEAGPRAAAAATGKDDDPLAEIEEGMVHALTLMTTDPQVRRVFDVATHKVEYTHDMASVQQRHLDARNACVADFEKALRLAARRDHIKLPVPGDVAAQGLHALLSGLIQNWLLDPTAFDLVLTGRRTFRVYLAGLGFARNSAAGIIGNEAEEVAV